MSNKIILEKNSTKIVIQSYKNYWLINESYTFYKKNYPNILKIIKHLKTWQSF
jgi:hypothetical protein